MNSKTHVQIMVSNYPDRAVCIGWGIRVGQKEPSFHTLLLSNPSPCVQ